MSNGFAILGVGIAAYAGISLIAFRLFHARLAKISSARELTDGPNDFVEQFPAGRQRDIAERAQLLLRRLAGVREFRVRSDDSLADFYRIDDDDLEGMLEELLGFKLKDLPRDTWDGFRIPKTAGDLIDSAFDLSQRV